MTHRCEPPPELRDVNGRHWVRWASLPPGKEYIAFWSADEQVWDGDTPWLNRDSGRQCLYIAPVASPEEVEALRAQLARCETACFDVQRDNITMRAENALLRNALSALASQSLGMIAVSDSTRHIVTAALAATEQAAIRARGGGSMKRWLPVSDQR